MNLNDFVHDVARDRPVPRKLEKLLHVRQRHIERATVTNEIKAFQMLGAVPSVPGCSARGRIDQAFPLVVPHRLNINAGLLG